MPLFNAIAAMSENRVIGNHGTIPWHIRDDFRWFKHKTMGGTLVMGRKTFESIGKPLPGRKTVVLTHRPLDVANVEVCSNLALFESDYIPKHIGENFWICGGGQVYSQTLELCQYLYLTTVKQPHEGDVYFPEYFGRVYVKEQLIHETPEFRIERWKNRKLPPELAQPPDVWPF